MYEGASVRRCTTYWTFFEPPWIPCSPATVPHSGFFSELRFQNADLVAEAGFTAIRDGVRTVGGLAHGRLHAIALSMGPPYGEVDLRGGAVNPQPANRRATPRFRSKYNDTSLGWKRAPEGMKAEGPHSVFVEGMDYDQAVQVI